MPDFFREFFSTGAFMPHGHCYLWKPGLLWLQVASNGIIALSYVAISVTLYVLVRRGENLPFQRMALAFGVFIIGCGFTHASDIYVIWQPAYWLDGSIRAVTAIASAGVAFMLPPLVPKARMLARGARLAHERGIELERAVEDISTLYERTKELDALKTEFFANVSHELRTPLALVLGPAERLLSAENLTEAQRRDVELVTRNARTLRKHVDDLLDIARLEAGKVELRYVSSDVAQIIRVVAGHFDGLAAERDMTYKIEGPRSLKADVDPEKLHRVLLNLFSNAFKFTPTGGVVRCSFGMKGSQIRIDVADSGPGIQPENRELVFQRFRQIDGTSTRRFGGTGLGLAIVRDFVIKHMGTIAIDDAPEGGALLSVRLPAKAPEGVEVASKPLSTEADEALRDARRQALDELESRVAAARTATTGDKPRVLVVEDNPEMNRFLKESLAADYVVDTAADGREGLERARSELPDLVVTDVMMPEMSGDELVRALRADPRFEAVPILVLSARAEDDLRLKLLSGGAQDYVIKPFSVEELRARIANLVTLKRARDVLQEELDTQIGDLEALAKDVTHRKRELATALESMRIAREQAERASHVKTNFLGMVSHELRTPLTTIQLQLQRLKQSRPDGLSDSQRTVVNRCLASTARLTDLIESLLQYTKIEAGRLDTVEEEVDVGKISGDVVDELRVQAERKGIALELDVEAPLPPALTDGRLVRLAIVNLVNNAVKFTDAGSVKVQVLHDGAHRISVRDTGPGIAPEERVRIFEPFEQLEPPRSKHQPGIGLGLTLVRQMIDAIGGTLEVDSHLGKGSTFTLVLPARSSSAATGTR